MKLFKVFDDIKNSKFVGDIKEHLKEELAHSAIDMQELKEEIANVKKGIQEKWQSQEVQDGLRGMKSDLQKQLESIRNGTFLEDSDSENTLDASTHSEAPKTRYHAPEKEYSLQEEMDKLVGLSRVKEALIKFEAYANYKKKAAANNISIPSSNMHMLFLGNPGTGKTVVARKMAKFLYISGIIQEEKVIEVSRKDLVGGYIGQTAITTDAKIQEAMGGILFIDEAYTLVKEDDPRDFGQEAVDTLLKAMEDYRDEFIVIVAGYEDLMERFINSNPGLKSRFTRNIYFPDYTADEMMKIFKCMCREYQYKLSNDAKKALTDKMISIELNKSTNFANAREVRNIFEEVVRHQASRISQNPDSDIMLIKKEDFR